jgi:hypothetical protein
MVGGVRKIARESAIGIRMTSLAGFHDAVKSHVGIRIVDILDIMGSVTVGTFGGSERAQSVGFPVDGLHVGFREMLMAGTALIRDLGHELVLLMLLDLVGGVAVFTVRKPFLDIRILDVVDTGHILFINSLVAGSAGGGQVPKVNRGAFVFVLQDEMGGVAVRAERDRQEPLFPQGLSVNTAGVIHQDIALSGLDGSGMVKFSVAVAAQLGDLGPVGLGAFIPRRENLVRSMTVRTVGGIGILFKISEPMAALKIIFRGLGMTVGAVGPPGRLTRALKLGGDVGVTFDAGDTAVDGILDFLLLDGERDLFPLNDLVDVRLFMALQALSICGAQDQILSPKRVRPVTVVAGGNGSGFLFPELTPDNLDMHLLDAGVAGGTGGGDVARGDGGAGVRVRQDHVVAVTVVAGGSNDQAAPEQSLAVDALGIIAQDIVFRDIVNPGDGGAFPVAFPAENRNVHLVSAGVYVRGRQDVVITVTFGAGGRVGCVSLQGAAMDAGQELLVRVFMTDPAGDLFQFLFLLGVQEVLTDILMAVHAVEIPVHGAGEAVEIDKDRHLSSPPLHGQVPIGMTGLAVFVALTE